MENDKKYNQIRLCAQKDLARAMAHDFANLMSPISGLSDLLLMQPQYLKDEKKALEYIKIIHDGIYKLTTRIELLRKFYWDKTLTKNDFRQLNLKTIISLVLLHYPKKENNSFIKTSLQQDLSIYGSMEDLLLMLKEIITNAQEAMLEEGTIYIRSYSDGKFIAIEIIDSGIGMDQQTKARCLEPYFTTKSSKNKGLGLAVVYGVMTRHDGEIAITSDKSRGTTITLRFPITDFQGEI